MAGVFSNQPVQAFKTIVSLFEGGPVITAPELAPLRHKRAGRPADRFDAAAEYGATLPGRWIYIGPKYHHFGHIMAEMVHRIIPSKQMFPVDQYLLVTGREDVGSNGFDDLAEPFRQVLEFCEIRPANVRILHSNTIVETLMICEQGSCLEGTPAAAYLDMLNAFSTPRLNGLFGAAGGAGRVYVSRSGVAHGGSFLGERYLENLLACEGWEIFHPEDHPFARQMDVYRKAAALVFAEGSACHGTELLGRQALNDVYLLARRQIALGAYSNVLAPRARHFAAFWDTYFLGTAARQQSTGKLLNEFGMSLIDIERLAAFFRSHGLARLEGCSVAAYLDAAEEDLRRYVAHFSPVAPVNGIGLADAWEVSELRLRFERQRQALLVRGGIASRPPPLPVDEVMLDETEDAETIEFQANAAHRAGNWAEAERCWMRHRVRFRDNPNGHLLGAMALMGLGRFDEAEALLTAGVARFPDLPQMCAAHALLAHLRGDQAASAERWSRYADRFPANSHGYAFGIDLLKRIERYDDAGSLLLLATRQFPDDPHIAAHAARMARHRADAATPSAPPKADEDSGSPEAAGTESRQHREAT
jgi:tetratricopeptide (TPR) repeat protein